LSKRAFQLRRPQEAYRRIAQAAHKGGTSRGAAFADFLEIVVCTLSGQQMEDAYLKAVKRYCDGEKGKRGVVEWQKRTGCSLT
jgi:hypothetical protein